MQEMEAAKGGEVPVSSQTRRAKQKKRSAESSALEPVLEHCELYPSGKGLFACSNNDTAAEAGKKKTGKVCMRILGKMRDGYVKLMNEVAAASDYSGVASSYGCPGSEHTAFNAWLNREEHQKQVLLRAVQLQMARSSRFSI